MAGRIVVLQFEDRDCAEAFVSHDKALMHDGAEIIGMFLAPKVFCECGTEGRKGRQNLSNWRRGKRTGIQVCVNCRRPSRYHMRGLRERLQILMGNDLMSGVK